MNKYNDKIENEIKKIDKLFALFKKKKFNKNSKAFKEVMVRWKLFKKLHNHGGKV
jgi:hypothetical protein